jgi:hypothetical protein
MLTKSEKEWMENRWKFSCWYCPNTPQVMCTMGERPAHCAIMDTDWKEAAEFSERVAAKLAELFATISLVGNATEFDCESSCPAFSVCCTLLHEGLPCDDAILMYARLKVEEEMDEQNPFD